MEKILVIYSENSDNNGGSQCCNRNIESIKEINGENNVIPYIITPVKSGGIRNRFARFLNILQGYFSGFDNKQMKGIANCLQKNFIRTVYIDRSIYGKVAKYIKQNFPNIRVVSFFHNCELDYFTHAFFASKKFLSFYNPLLAYYNEKLACEYSDDLIVLNKRDKDAISRHYGRTPQYTIPITFKSWYKPKIIESIIRRPLQALFVGSYFYGNIEGLKWFVKKILPKVNITLTIVGSGMEKLASDVNQSNKLMIYGKVSDLTEYYENADFMILPILSGGGMKVKTAEALMFGKYIVGTPEAFIGYDVDDSIAKICTTTNEFIETINSLSLKSKFNLPSRELFENKYSYHNSLEIFRKILKYNI